MCSSRSRSLFEVTGSSLSSIPASVPSALYGHCFFGQFFPMSLLSTVKTNVLIIIPRAVSSPPLKSSSFASTMLTSEHCQWGFMQISLSFLLLFFMSSYLLRMNCMCFFFFIKLFLSPTRCLYVLTGWQHQVTSTIHDLGWILSQSILPPCLVRGERGVAGLECY